MGWEVGYDNKWKRDIGYGVPAHCDEPGCEEKIHRGLAYVCLEGQPYGGDEGCGLYFCEKHRGTECSHDNYEAKPDHPEWIHHKMTAASWTK